MAGWEIARTTSETVSLICFTGGADIDPSFYEEQNVQSYDPDLSRDYYEYELFESNKDIPKVGICRGGQFLNVLSGGKLWQHVDNHIGDHDITDLLTGQPLSVSSTHHQMMRLGPKGQIVAVADRAVTFVHDGKDPKPEYDPEVAWYEHTSSLCFQPHPEYGAFNSPCRRYFFDLIEYFFGYTSK